MKALVISSNCSGGGKTTITLGIMRALMKKGYEIQGFKVGPDYIDTAFHSFITKKPCRNLDLYLMGEAGVKEAFSRGTGDMAIVEGVMGLYDGKCIDGQYSTAHLSKVLNLPVILVISPKAQSTTLCAELNGIRDFDRVNIKGIILNGINEAYYKLLKYAIEKHCHMLVLGYVPKDERLSLKSRHLGLIQSSEVQDLEEKIEICSELIMQHVDMEALEKCFGDGSQVVTKDYSVDNHKLRIGVPMDKAFSFYYRENLELLESSGQVVYFSPLKDEKLPEALDFLYIGGGYPEVFIEELSKNSTMLQSMKTALQGGLHCYAECGGLMYLTEGIVDQQGKFLPLVGFFKGKTYMTKALQNFGYATITVDKENHILNKGLVINTHEFHKSKVELEEATIYNLQKETFDGNVKQWSCGYLKNNTIATYGHVNFLGNMDFFNNLLFGDWRD